MRRTEGEETWDAVYEVYYDDHGNVTGWTDNFVSPVFYRDIDSGGLRDEINRFLLACDQPILDWHTGKEIQ